MTNDITRRGAMRLGFGAIASALAAPALATAAAPKRAHRARAVILLFMHGGPSQFETFDPKPRSRSGGGQGTTPTPVAGVHFAQGLPKLARGFDKLAVIRSITSTEGNHDRARHLLHTGYPPQGGADHPAFGAYLAQKHTAGPLPGYVAIGGPGSGSGFLGPQWAPFVVRNPTRPVRNIRSSIDLPRGRHEDRLDLWRRMQRDFEAGRSSQSISGHTAVVEQAAKMMSATELAAFNIDDEPARTLARYGDTRFARGCVMARRLVESGVPFVEVSMPGWDTHEDNAGRTATLCADLDRAMSALLEDLASRGLLDETLVVWLGEFGRTPEINERGGRNHFPQVTPAVVAGAGVPGGQIIGATDPDGRAVVERPVQVVDLFRTLAVLAGIDPDKTSVTPGGRPISVVDGGSTMRELL